MKRSPRTVFTLVAVLALPLTILQVWIEYAASGASFVGSPLALFSGSSEWSRLAGLALPSLRVTFVAAAMAPLVLARYRGFEPGVGDLLGGFVRRLPAIAVVWIVVHLLEAAGVFVAFFGLLFMMIFCSCAIPALVIGQIGPMAAVGRSFSVVGSGFLRATGMLTCVALVETSLRWSFGSVLWLLIGREPDTLGFVLGLIVGVGSDLVLVPFVAGCTIALYLDLLVRQSGLDLDLRLEAVGAS